MSELLRHLQSRSLRVRRLACGMLVALVVTGIWILPALVNHSLKRITILGRHAYELPEHVPFLTEEVALTFARRMLEREGFSLEAWIPVEDRRTSSPDHKPDKYLVRNAFNPNDGFIRFKNEALNESRYVSVVLSNKQVMCSLTRPF